MQRQSGETDGFDRLGFERNFRTSRQIRRACLTEDGERIKNARDLESLVDDFYIVRDQRGSVYKFAGMPFWNIVGHLEDAIFDIPGKIAGVSVGDLLRSDQLYYRNLGSMLASNICCRWSSCSIN